MNEALDAYEGTPPTIIDVLKSKEFFAPAFNKIETWTNWEIFCKGIYGLPLGDAELDTFQKFTGRSPRPDGFREAYCIVGRRGGKSRITGLLSTYEAIFGNFYSKLSPGETAWIFVIATDKNQAKIVFGYIQALLELVPEVIDSVTSDEIRLKNHVTISVKTASFKASRGYSTAVIILDELAFFRNEESVNPAAEIVNSLLPGLLPNGLLLGISTPYAKFGYLYDTWKENYGKDESDILIWKAPTMEMNPTYSQAIIDRLVKRDKTVFVSEYNAEFRDDVTSFIDGKLVQELMLNHSIRPPEVGRKYSAFIDPSGGKSDSMTLAIAHQEENKIILDYIDERKPPFNPTDVVEDFIKVMQEYHVHSARGDRYGGIWVSDCFEKRNFKYVMSDLDKNEIYHNFAPLLNMRRVELIENERLLFQLSSLERKTRSGGKDIIDHPNGMKDDLANAVAGVCVFVSRDKYWTAEQMNSNMPFIIGHQRSKQFFVRPSRAREEAEAELRRDMNAIRIVRKTGF